MIYVSNEFKTLMQERTDFKEVADILFTDGRRVTLDENDFTISNNYVTDCAGANSIPLGAAIQYSWSSQIQTSGSNPTIFMVQRSIYSLPSSCQTLWRRSSMAI